jgi:cell wall-associated NlpC family hydrolase
VKPALVATVMVGALVGGLTAVVVAVDPPPATASADCNVTGATGPVAGPWAGLDSEQIQNAQIIAAVVTARKLPVQATLIAEMTARQESGLRNIQHGDAAGPDSRGLFQQRSSWGPEAGRLNPAAATGLFLDRLVSVAVLDTMAPQHAAHIVQVNQNEDDYTKWIPWAVEATRALSTGAGVLVTCGPAAPVTPGTGTGNNVAGQTTVPAGFTFTGTTKGNKAAAWALLQLGKPYVWAAAGPEAFDCSGLTMAAWATQGVQLPHYTVTQMAEGVPSPVDLSHAVSGDLVFIPGSDGTAAAPGHVGVVAGVVTTAAGSRVWIVQAPMTGVPVEITDSKDWAGQIVSVRHIG